MYQLKQEQGATVADYYTYEDARVEAIRLANLFKSIFYIFSGDEIVAVFDPNQKKAVI